jgi:ribosomal protein S18 acetylase RimI-like enzyme
MKITISCEGNPSPNDLRLLSEGICAEAHKKRGLNKGEAFCFFARDETAKLIGGITGWMFYGCLYIDELWIDEVYRSQGLGSTLMIKAEELASNKNCSFATVNTMDFEAKPFYEKLGYRVEFERKGYEKDSIFYFLRKELIS